MKKRKLHVFFSVYLLITVLLIWKFIAALSLTGLPAVAVAIALAMIASTIPANTIVGKRGPRRVRRFLYVAGGLSIVWLLWGLIATVIIDTVRFVALVIGFDSVATLTGPAMIVAASVILGVTVYGAIRARQTPRFAAVDIPIDSLPGHLEGVTIVQLSDLHIGPIYGARYLRNIVRKVNALDPDLVVLTGDQADGDLSEFIRNARPLRNLTARFGVFACHGNHDHYAGSHAIANELESAGITTLVNTWREVAPDLVVAGIDDPAHVTKSPVFDDVDKTLARIPESATTILLAHQPHVFEHAASVGADLVLSGHTHGGQIVPWNYIVRRFYPNDAGHYRSGQSNLYVSRGVGTWGPPIRIGARSEVPVLVLRKATVPAELAVAETSKVEVLTSATTSE